MIRILVGVCGLLALGAASAQNIPLLRINPETLALYKKAEPLEQAGNLAGVLEVWRARLEAGDDLGRFESGVVLLRAKAGSAEVARGLDLIRKSAEAGYVRAQLRLHFIYRHGLAPLVQPDPAQSIAWLRRSADQGFATALVHLGLAHESGYGVARDMKQAFALIQRAAAQNHPFGLLGLGAAHESGIGVPVDLQRARSAYNQAMERTNFLLTRPNVAYVYRTVYEKWVVDLRAALAGLESTATRLEAEQAKLAEERRKVEAENARLAAERKRIADEDARRAAEEGKRVEDERFAAERRRMEAERAQLADERRRIEAENARLAEEERRKAAERKAAEEARLAEERRQLEAEQARIVEERRRIEAEAARVAEERRRDEEARVAAAKTAAKPSAAPTPATAPTAQRPGGENDMAATFGRLVRGLATGIQVARGVQAAVSGARARDEGRFTQGLDQILGAAGLGPVSAAVQPATAPGATPGRGSAGSSARIPPGAQAPVIATTGNSGVDCEAALDVVKDEFKRAQPGNAKNTVVLLESQMRLYADTLALVHRYCPNDPKYTRFQPDLQKRFAEAQTTCNRVASAGCDLNNGRRPR